MERTPAIPRNLVTPAVKAAIEADQVACGNCQFAHMNLDFTWACWKAPPTAVAAWVQTRDGTMTLQVGGARAPVERDAWCGEFKRKTSA